MARDSCMTRVAAGVAIGGAVGGAVGNSRNTPFVFSLKKPFIMWFHLFVEIVYNFLYFFGCKIHMVVGSASA